MPAEKAGSVEASEALPADFNPTFESTGESAPATSQNNGLSIATLKGLLTGTTGWYAPACNIHRIAICGRTREYFSEDAYLSGAMAYSIASTAQAHGVVTYTKHFALNEQENNRSSVCTFSNEQAVREIYLKPFETSVGTEGGGMGIMTSMNRVGAVYSSSDYALCTTVLRDEWGFHGVVITDFVSGPNDKIVPREMFLAGTDLFLCTLSDESMFIDGYAKDADVLNALRESAHRIGYTYVNSNVMNGLSSSTRVVSVTPAWKYGLYAVDAVVVYLLYLLALSPVVYAGVVLIVASLIGSIIGNVQYEKQGLNRKLATVAIYAAVIAVVVVTFLVAYTILIPVLHPTNG